MVVSVATSGLSARYEYRSNTVIIGPLPRRLRQTLSDRTALDDMFLAELEELEAIQAYDAAIASGEIPIPLEEALTTIEAGR